MSLFSRMDRITSRTVDRTFGVAFECHPSRATPNGRPSADPERPQWDGKGVLDENTTPLSVEIGRRDGTGHDLHTPVMGSATELSIDRHRYPQASKARQGDRILTDDARWFEITSVRPDGMARIVLSLVRLSRRPV